MVTSISRHLVLHAKQAAHAWQGGLQPDPWGGGMNPQARSRLFQRLSEDEADVTSCGAPATRAPNSTTRGACRQGA
jgi:hypothetical protein